MSFFEWVRFYFFYAPTGEIAFAGNPFDVFLPQRITLLVVLAILVLAIFFFAYRKFKRIGPTIGVTLPVVLLGVLSVLWLQSYQWRSLLEPYYAEIRQQSAVLQGAKITVHMLTRISTPKFRRWGNHSYSKYEMDELTKRHTEEVKDKDWYLVDVTVTPQSPASSPSSWHPGGINCVPSDFSPGTLSVYLPEEAYPRVIGRVKYIDSPTEEGKWEDARRDIGNEGFEGEQRLRLTIGLDKGTKAARFRYYLKVLDRIDLAAASKPD